MAIIEFYEHNGKSELVENLEKLRKDSIKNKDVRIQYKQICLYIELLQINGNHLPEIISKYLEKEIWELRSGVNRIFYFNYLKDIFVLLHMFRKKSQKTPRRELEKALKEKDMYKEKRDKHENLE